MDNQEGRWITTKYGKRVFLTNEYMNNKIRNEAQKDKIVLSESEKEIEKRIKNKEIDVYHGTYLYFRDFDDNYIGSSSASLSYGKGHYFFDNEKDVYSDIVYHAKVTLKKPFVSEMYKFQEKLDKMNYNYSSNIDISDFLKEKGYDATIIIANNKIEEIVIYSNKDKKINIISRNERQ